jgi:fatty-acyl-CoA synthase
LSERHIPYWPAHVPREIPVPARSIYANLRESATRAPGAEAINYYGARISYGHLLEDCERLAGFLQVALGVAAGEPVLLQMQNSPQFVIAHYAILRARAVVVPLNPMLREGELDAIARETEARVMICAQDLMGLAGRRIEAGALRHAVIAAYSDLCPAVPSVPAPPSVLAPRAEARGPGLVTWSEALAAGMCAKPEDARPGDLCLIAYTSGSTGRPRGCMHPHRTVMANIVAYAHWIPMDVRSAVLGALPLFHVTGMQGAMHAPIYSGARTVLMTRWDAGAALGLTRAERITHWRLITTMLIDMLGHRDFTADNLRSLDWIGGGGASMPEAVAARIEELTGRKYIEGYGLSETAAATHINPPDRPKRQCLGIPFVGVSSLIVEPDTLRELGVNEVGEILISGPQVFAGYWRNEEATSAAFVEIGGRRYFRSGDLGYSDEEGYFFLVDRLKRMINAAGFKVWPAEVEALLHAHPGIRQACVVGSGDPRRGETVKAYLVPREGARLDPGEIAEWCRERMARYKVPAAIDVVEALPLLASGKVDWRTLQDEERKRSR